MLSFVLEECRKLNTVYGDPNFLWAKMVITCNSNQVVNLIPNWSLHQVPNTVSSKQNKNRKRKQKLLYIFHLERNLYRRSGASSIINGSLQKLALGSVS